LISFDLIEVPYVTTCSSRAPPKSETGERQRHRKMFVIDRKICCSLWQQ